MESEDENKWKDFNLSINGKEIKGVTSISYTQTYTIEELKNQLSAALEKEDYLLCADIQKQIDQIKLQQ